MANIILPTPAFALVNATTTVASSNNPSTFGESVTFTATVTGTVAAPTGTVAFKDGATTLGTVTLNGGILSGTAQATLSTSSLSAGSHSITAVYSGDLVYNSGTSAPLSQTVNQITTSTTVSSSNNPSAHGDTVTFTATVTSSGGTPAGTVTFKDGSTTLGSATLDGSGQATYATSSLSLGSHSITAVYNGSTNYSASTSSPLTQTVTNYSSSTTVTSSANPSTYGTSVTFTATVSGSGGTPTGTVTFKDGSSTLGSLTLSGGQAALSTAALSAGSHSITAVYGGDSNYASSTSSALTQTVNQKSGAVTVTSSANPSAYGQSVTFTATVTSSVGTPTGTATFKDGNAVLGTVNLSGSSATLSTSALAIGSHSIMVRYNGDGNFKAENSSVLTQSVQEPPDSVKLRALQVATAPVIAQVSGQVLTSAIGAAIDAGFADTCTLFTPSRTGIRIATDGSGCANERVNTAFSALAKQRSDRWILWSDIEGTGWNTNAPSSNITGHQINALLGWTHRLTPDFLVGVLAGYESFKYDSQSLGGELRGDGWTLGGYLGWRFMPSIRLDLGAAISRMNYDVTAGTASASIPGYRALATIGLTGSYNLAPNWMIEPSFHVYSLWETESSYTDSLGVAQDSYSFATGRTSAGAKVTYRWGWSDTTTLTPYLGGYVDYYFNTNSSAPTSSMVDGMASHIVAGMSLTTNDGMLLALDGNVGGLGSRNFIDWAVKGRAAISF